jgi:hypothetical protein
LFAIIVSILVAALGAEFLRYERARQFRRETLAQVRLIAHERLEGGGYDKRNR